MSHISPGRCWIHLPVGKLPSLKRTACTWKWMVGIRNTIVSFWGNFWAYFQVPFWLLFSGKVASLWKKKEISDAKLSESTSESWTTLPAEEFWRKNRYILTHLQVIQSDPFHPPVGGHQQPLKGSRFDHPKKVTSRIARLKFNSEFTPEKWPV